mgnify:FL=1
MIFAEVGLMTMDVPRLSKFYREVLKTESDCDDDVHQEIRTNGAALTIYNDGSIRESANNNVILAFTVDNVDEEYDRLLQLHVKIIEPPTTRPWGARNMYFEDPDGNTVVFRSFL